jgi:hypothetical protein
MDHPLSFASLVAAAHPDFKIQSRTNGRLFSLVAGASCIAPRFYKVTRVLPTEGRERLYRIKTIAEAFERVARESELLAASGDPMNSAVF